MEYERHMSTSPLSTIDKARDGGVGSAGKSVGTPNSVRQISFSGGGSLKEEHDERQKLEKSNFDLKMRVYYLEEALKKFQDTDLGNSDNDELASEVSTLRLDLEEKKIELERRNLLLIKAKGAIETLKNEMERLKSENDGFKDQEDRVHRLKQLNEHVEADYHAQIAELENQLAAARDIASARDRERINAEEKLAHMEISYMQVNEKLREVEEGKESAEAMWLQTRHNLGNNEDELMEARAQVDLYKIQINEKDAENQSLRSKLKEIVGEKLKADNEHKTVLHDLNVQYEQQIRTIRQNHEKELEKLRETHSLMLADVRENYEFEMNHAKELMEKTIQQVKSEENADFSREKDHFEKKLTEKNEEIRTLRSLLESDRSRIEILSVELENARRELHGNYDKTEKLKTQIFSLESEVKVVNDLREAVDALRAENHTATSKWKQEMVEKAQINARAEKLADSLEEIQLLLRQREDELESSKMELNRLLRDKVELGSKAENIENISRENERLKAANEKIQAELIDYNTRYNELKSEFSLAREELQRQNAEMSRIKDAVDSSRQQANEYKSERDEVEEMYHTEKGKLAAAEATVSELRSILVSVRGDYEKERNEKLVTSRELESNLEKIDELQHQLGTACVMCYVAMAKWDNALSTALDGDTFSDGSSNAANTISTHNRLTLYGSNNNNHPSRHKQHHNYRSWEETEEDEMKLEVLSLSSEQILQRTAVQIERIQLKIDRAGKIRKLFESQAKRMMESTQQSVQIVQEKSALLFHRVSEANLETKRVESIFLRDRKQREDEFIELKRFRESLVNEHSSQLRESDARAVTAKERLEQEQRSAEKLRLENQRLHEEIRSLQRAYDDLKEDINDLTLAEQVVSDLNHRVNELMNVNRSLSKEVEEKQSTILNLRHDHHQIMQEKTSLLTNMEKQYSQLQARDELISDYEAKLNRFLKEIERLRARQINPELAQTILDTQSWVNGTQKNIANTNRYHSSAVSSPNEKIAASERGFSDASDQLLSITQLTTSADVLIARSADMVSRFESIVDSLKSPRPSLRDSATIKSFEQDLFELLESNSKLTLHLHQVASELKRFIRRSMDQKIETASHDVLPPSTLKYDAPHYSRPPISSDGAVNTHHGTPFVHKDMTIAELTADGLHSGIKATPVPPPKEFIDDDYIPRRTTNLSGFKSHFPMNTIRSQQLSSDRRENFSSEREVKSSNSILLQTPNTAARASAARLSKLGSDLNELARKLDAFDSYDGSKR